MSKLCRVPNIAVGKMCLTPLINFVRVMLNHMVFLVKLWFVSLEK